ncbi:hypothetical protein R3I93_013277 [Phoxinus phoxinus]|uniref:Uncharacterized protein n=1 Tax=Phoxinus phoxinus TaxID=58324 RepID=A0AAN9CPF8_9TELE
MVLVSLTVLYVSLRLTAADPPSELKHGGCIKVNECKCLMRDGSGLIDLGSVADEDGFIQRLKPLPSAPQTPDVLLSFSPCLAFSEPERFGGTDCTGVAVCVSRRIHQDNGFVTQYFNYGKHNGNKFSFTDSEKTLSVSYSMFPDSEPQTVVHYRCSPNRSVTSSVSLSERALLQMWVESPCACPNACALVDVGPGTILLIILCISVTAYFIIGSCALRPFRTSNGVQMAPEDSVWCKICCQLTVRRKQNCSL